MTVNSPRPVNRFLADTITSPISETRRWLEQTTPKDDQPLINVSQAAPLEPPPEALRAAMADAVMNEAESHLYGPVLGMPELRTEVASHWSDSYGAALDAQNVGITSGCNQAFCAAISSLAGPGDAVILPAPWYFNHKMWLDMVGIECRVLMCGEDMLPDPNEAAAMMDERVKAIILVTPNNPSGVEYPNALLYAFYQLAKSAGIALVVDETYRDFSVANHSAHELFGEPNWHDTLIHLYSFSKAYRLTGHRVGAVLSSPARLTQMEKFLDTMSICPNQLGQRGALFGLQNLSHWLAGERMEIGARCATMSRGFPALNGWEMKGCGAYFAYASHPFEAPSDQVAKALLERAAILALPGTMFSPTLAQGGNGHAERHFRFAFANIDSRDIALLFERLAAFYM